MNKKDQKWLIMLYALIELDGGGTKQQVLNHIQVQGYWHKSDQNDDFLPSRPELRWRNDFAFERSHLVKGGYMQKGLHDVWRITKKGRSYYLELAKKARNLDLEHVTETFLDKLFREQMLPEAADQLLFEQICRSDTSSEDLLAIVPGTPLPKGSASRNGNRNVYIRNPQTSRNALFRANHKCELDPTHASFQRKHSPNLYMEPHHLIPMSMTDHFDVTLDREQNIFSLCSNCHNQVHYGTKEDIRKLISQLFFSREKEICSILKKPITIEDLCQIYNV
ncbi:MAG: HNH endonuclease [Oscillospiraceae bacterium]|nr:HNH endonuclease [Oscillospiraceae bacterium]